MNIILLSNGFNKRLWPLSNEARGVQFLKVFAGADGAGESLAQRMVRTIRAAEPDSRIVFAACENQVPQIRAQFGDGADISVAHDGRGSFAAIAMAAARLAAQGAGGDEPVVVCPLEGYLEADYPACLAKLRDAASRPDAADLTLMGVEPIGAGGSYGLIVPAGSGPIAPVARLLPPNADEAGALWNVGVFAFRPGRIPGMAQSASDGCAASDEADFCEAVAGQGRTVGVVRVGGAWRNLENWDALTGVMSEAVAGNAMARDCENTHVVNELGIPMIALGMKDAVIVATPDGILATGKARSPELGKYVGEARAMYERRGWGEYRVLDQKLRQDARNSLTKELVIAPGQHISYQRHRHRTEVWTFIEGSGDLILDDEVRRVNRGDVAVIAACMKHAIRAVDGELRIIEVQIGDQLIENDIERFDWDW